MRSAEFWEAKSKPENKQEEEKITQKNHFYFFSIFFNILLLIFVFFYLSFNIYSFIFISFWAACFLIHSFSSIFSLFSTPPTRGDRQALIESHGLRAL